MKEQTVMIGPVAVRLYPGLLLVVRRQSGTQLVRVVSWTEESIRAFVLSGRSRSWTKTPRRVLLDRVVGRFEDCASPAQVRAIEAAGGRP